MDDSLEVPFGLLPNQCLKLLASGAERLIEWRQWLRLFRSPVDGCVLTLIKPLRLETVAATNRMVRWLHRGLDPLSSALKKFARWFVRNPGIVKHLDANGVRRGFLFPAVAVDGCDAHQLGPKAK